LVVDTADHSNLVSFLQPLKVIGECVVTPVSDLTAVA
jgi:hypothetical protein